MANGGMGDLEFPRQGYLILQGWAGRTETLCEVVRETRTRYYIKALIGMSLGRRSRWLNKGETACVPKRAIALLPKPGDVIEGGNDATTDAKT